MKDFENAAASGEHYRPTVEQLRDPEYAFVTGVAFAERFGILPDPLEQPQAYDEKMYQLNPRTAKQMLRFELEDFETRWGPADESLIHETAKKLGIKEPEYLFPEGGSYDVLLVAGGARNAPIDRAEFACEALASGLITARKVLVAGDSRKIADKERAAVSDWAPDAQTANDMADAAVDRMRNNYPDLFGDGGTELSSFYLKTAKPDQRAAVSEAILREGIERGGSLAVATTALYVPFKTHKSEAVARPLGVNVDVAGVRSRSMVVEARTTDTYFSEVTQTLMSAAQHRAAARRL